MVRKLLLTVDAQIDFINGTLPVPGAKDAMDKLASYIKEHDGDYAIKAFTTDWHPFRHCSFSDNGGKWPMHCVQNSQGAAIWFPLIAAAATTEGKTVVLRKGDKIDKDEYSIFDNDTSSGFLQGLVDAYNIADIEICGLAGNVCVLNTLKDAIKLFGKDKVSIIPELSPSLDNGKDLNAFIKENSIRIITI